MSAGQFEVMPESKGKGDGSSEWRREGSGTDKDICGSLVLDADDVHMCLWKQDELGGFSSDLLGHGKDAGNDRDEGQESDLHRVNEATCSESSHLRNLSSDMITKEDHIFPIEEWTPTTPVGLQEDRASGDDVESFNTQSFVQPNALEKALVERDQKIDDLQKIIAKLKERRINAKALLKLYKRGKEKIISLAASNGKAESGRKRAEEDLSRTERELRTARLRVQELLSSRHAAEQKVEALKNVAKAETNKELQKQLDTAISERDTGLAEARKLHEDLRELQMRNEELRSRLKQAEESLGIYSDSLTAEKRAHQVTHRQLEETEQKLAVLIEQKLGSGQTIPPSMVTSHLRTGRQPAK